MELYLTEGSPEKQTNAYMRKKNAYKESAHMITEKICSMGRQATDPGEPMFQVMSCLL